MEVTRENYFEEREKFLQLKYKDSLSVPLKESRAKKPVCREKNGFWEYVCPTCGSLDEEVAYEWNYCPYCGQELEWE